MKATNINIADKVLEKVKAGKVSMKPKMIFILQKLGLRTSFSFLILLSLFSFSLIIFLVRQQPTVQAIGLDSKGFWLFFKDLPFTWFVLSTLFLVTAVVIFRKYTLAYRKSFKKTLMTLTLLIIIISSLFSLTGFHEALAAKAAEGRGFFKQIYQRALSCDFDNEYHLIGKVTSFNKVEKKAQVITWGHVKTTFTWSSETKFISVPKVDDFFLAVGYKNDDGFVAQGIRRITLSSIKNRCLSEGKQLNPEKLKDNN